MDSHSPVYNLSPMCNLSEDELDAVNLSNAEFAMWDPYKEKKRADEAEKQIDIYKERALTSEAKVEELLNIIRLSRNELIKNTIKESLEAEETVLPEEKPNRWLSCLSTVKDKINTNYDTELILIALEHSVHKIEDKLNM
tara:strand:- start:452 stop:871 length:420 start_codon:yes stop_codon:yes gene_type:complete